MSVFARHLLGLVMSNLVRLLAPIFYRAAKSGIGIDHCRRLGFHPLLVHFYTPVPEYEEIPGSYFCRAHQYSGFSLDLAKAKRELMQLSQYAKECSWPENDLGDGRYYWSNSNFGFCSAALLHCVVRSRRSTRIVEVGGGFSTLICLEALALSRKAETSFTCIEPFPQLATRKAIAKWSTKYRARLIESKVQETPKDVLTSLEENDILFIDSSHVAKLGSDVNFLLLDILPSLKKGVLVHVHDIYLPYEYPREQFWGRQKYFWNEQYCLAAFLTMNPGFEVSLPAFWLIKDAPSEFRSVFPQYDAVRHRTSSSFWMVKCV